MSVPEKLDWNDPAAVRAWAQDVYVQMKDAIGAAEDATRPLGRRELGRRAARRIITQVDVKLSSAFQFAGISDEAPTSRDGA